MHPYFYPTPHCQDIVNTCLSYQIAHLPQSDGYHYR
jgi:hypothetical protein